MQLDAAGTEVKTIHFLGMIHLLDWGSGSWSAPKGDHAYSHFVGDKAGDILLAWSDGAVEQDAGAVSVRLGPLPAGRRIISTKLNGRAVACREEHSGDSRWAWIETDGGTEARIGLVLAAVANDSGATSCGFRRDSVQK